MPPKKSHQEEGFQMAPMIDMVFLLLVFFMCVSSMADADRSIELNLPDSFKSKIPDDLSNRGVVSLDADGRMYLGVREVDEEALKDAVGELIKTRKNIKIVIRADRGTRYLDIKSALKICADAGACDIIYSTYEK